MDNRGKARMLQHTRRALIGALLVSAALAGCTSDPPEPDPFAAFISGWQRADFTGVDLRTPAGQPLSADAAKQLLADTEGDLGARRPVVARHGTATVRKNDATTKAGSTGRCRTGGTGRMRRPLRRAGSTGGGRCTSAPRSCTRSCPTASG